MQGDGSGLAQSVALGVLWLAVLIADLRTRRIPIPLLLGLTLGALMGQSWPWWALAGTMLLWPTRRSAILLMPVAIGVGVVTSSPAPAMAIAAGSAAWALGWWGGADSIALAVLGLRYGLTGLIVGAIAVAFAGLLIMLIRRRALSGLLAVLPEAIALQARESAEIPAEAEMPAAAALAVAGLVLEVTRLLAL
jgi:Flp pilus assembly protein protease CpaA